jgi:hypothetical protein
MKAQALVVNLPMYLLHSCAEQRAAALGLSQYGGNRAEMQRVDHTDCKYPRTTDQGDRMSYALECINIVLGVSLLPVMLLDATSAAVQLLRKMLVLLSRLCAVHAATTRASVQQ